MRISTLLYCLKQGIINICRNVLFSLASVATISACIFLFCLFFSLIANVQNITHTAETKVGITVFFNDDINEQDILTIGNEIKQQPNVREIRYISAEEAWEGFQKEYFKDMEGLAEGFADDNPLAGSASYEIFLEDISKQNEMVTYLNGTAGVRRVVYSNAVVAGFSSLNRIIGGLSAVIIGILLAVSVFLISNTIHVAAAFRKNENEIMRLIGATNFMIRAPFVVEGVILGLLGAVIPLSGMYYIYHRAVGYIMNNFGFLTGDAAGVFNLLPAEAIFPSMVSVALGLGVGIGFFVSFFTIRKHLKV
ncbi:permease-like cell division protein FtsX [Clostridium sp. AM58-1XD]|uniref:cell division protein FtsX n=1 Tax=Clostridium sp. AM58-1XD TaxID=2292307 RepID=UPI000E4868AF|nr:permease-like cell division protein FtsX [Clostridium sp. AM58-1XD]RGY98254.1 ABC transporter permease [Clostridium sp. AM58-1XD]